MNHTISDDSLMNNFNFSNYRPFPLSSSSSTSSQPYVHFPNYEGLHDHKHVLDPSSGLVLDVEALAMADVGSNGISEGKRLEGLCKGKEMTDDGKRKGEKVRKPRHAFQTRSQVDILDDGYHWRKYGQKAVKNNKFPRSYYRCTYQGCNVKKQVQRLTMDEAVVVTTYEGVHSHAIQKSTDDFDHILSQLHIYSNQTTSF